jgi:hypothetical protein
MTERPGDSFKVGDIISAGSIITHKDNRNVMMLLLKDCKVYLDRTLDAATYRIFNIKREFLINYRQHWWFQYHNSKQDIVTGLEDCIILIAE